MSGHKPWSEIKHKNRSRHDEPHQYVGGIGGWCVTCRKRWDDPVHPTGRSRHDGDTQALREHVYLGIVIPPPDYPPRPMVVAEVFADEAKALEWRDEQPPITANSSYRRIEKREITR